MVTAEASLKKVASLSSMSCRKCVEHPLPPTWLLLSFGIPVTPAGLTPALPFETPNWRRRLVYILAGNPNITKPIAP
jgi:hypothetical protein